MTCEQFQPKLLILNDRYFLFQTVIHNHITISPVHRAGEYELDCRLGYTMQKPRFLKGSEASHGGTAALK
jgi:hypothetical protein